MATGTCHVGNEPQTPTVTLVVVVGEYFMKSSHLEVSTNELCHHSNFLLGI